MEKNTNEYVAQEVECADPVRLVELLYQRALRDLEGAREHWPLLARNGEAVRLAVHAQMILRELYNSVNVRDGGELAVHLRQLYEFMQYQLMNVVTERSADGPDRIAEIIELLQPLSDAWSTMAREQQQSASSSLLHGGTLVA